MEITKERDMPLLSRKRLYIMIDTDGATPSRQSLVKEIAKKLKTREDLVIIKHIYPQFGQNKTKLIVHIYKDKDKVKMFEHGNLLKKHESKPEEPQEKPVDKPEEKPEEKQEKEPEEQEKPEEKKQES